jgi:hypothetical protein
MGYQARASLHPGDFTESGFGILVASDQLAGMNLTAPAFLGLDHVDLRLIGAFGAYAGNSWKVLGTLYHASAQLYYTGSTVSDHFTVGYLQGERRLSHDLTAFARWEDADGAADSPYLKLFQGFARSRHVLGLRWDFARRQAATVQFTDSHTLQGRFSDVRVQWSAALF